MRRRLRILAGLFGASIWMAAAAAQNPVIRFEPGAGWYKVYSAPPDTHLTGPPDVPPGGDRPPEPAGGLRSPELSGNDAGVYAFQELDPASFDDYLALGDQPPDRLRKLHPGFVLSAWIKVGTDAEFDACIGGAGADPAESPRGARDAENNRLVVAFEQFATDGVRLSDRVAKFGFEVDLFGNVFPCVAAGTGGGMRVGTTETENQALPDFEEIASCAVVLTQPIRRMCLNPAFKFEYKTDVKTAKAADDPPAAGELQRWKRYFIHFYPRVGGDGLADGARRFVVSLYPKQPADPAAPRLTHFVDGVMFQASRYPTPWTGSKTFILGPAVDFKNGVINDLVQPLNSEIPYQVR